MKYRKLGQTGIEVSEIGFGAWGIGGHLWQDSKDDESLQALNRAIDLGVNFIDTAVAYGEGHSERLIARVLKAHRDKRIYVSTKVNPKNYEWPARKGVDIREVFPTSYIVERTEQSLKNLGVERLDLEQLHVWNDEWVNTDEWRAAFEKLRREGKVWHFGISINDHQPENGMQMIDTGEIATVQVIYNIFDQSPETKLLPACEQKSIGVIVRVPFDEGSLTGSITEQTVFSEGDFRANYFRGDRKKQVVERVAKLRRLLNGEAGTLPELALRFVLNPPAVATVIPGMRKAKNVEANVAVSDGRCLSEDLLAELRNHSWIRNFYE
ncbi:MAG: aldo/keto reductase [Acidobacteriia bacterium]|nr:aldo/keto reductase [Terriglobia bacterium]